MLLENLVFFVNRTTKLLSFSMIVGKLLVAYEISSSINFYLLNHATI